jgi:toxin ParE1/3/4
MILLDDAAREDLLAAVEWYDDQRAGLGSDLLACVDAALLRVAETPEAFPVDPANARARRAPVQRFPYVIVFVVLQRDVRVIAVAHAKRRPAYWKGRPAG